VVHAALEDGLVSRVTGVVDPDPGARGDFDAAGPARFVSSPDVPVARAGDRALVTLSSLADEVAAEVIRLVSAGYHVVTTCAELAWPPRHIWEALHTAARTDGRSSS